MFLVLKLLYHEVEKAEEHFYRDARVAHLPLLGTPWPMAAILTVYLAFVLKWGPKLMENRKPFNVKLPMQIYNIAQVVLNAYIFVSSLKCTYTQPHFSFSCQEYNVQDMHPSNMDLRYSAYVYYITKYLDLLDTVFFVLRKKNNQITFLHVYHHTIMVFGVWVYITLQFASHFTATGILNSLVHVCMYIYYFISTLQLKINLTPWKKRLTQMQILQFCVLSLHFLWPIMNNWCGLDMFWNGLAFVQNLFILSLFLDFYYKAYVNTARKAAKPSHGVPLPPKAVKSH